MTKPTRYVVVGGFAVLALGLVAAGVAYVEGRLPAFARAQGVPAELRYFPANATMLAFADVHGVMASELSQRLREVSPKADSEREFESRTGIDIEEDIDKIIACLVPGTEDLEGLMIATGRFESQRLEALAREHGGVIEDYLGVRLVTHPTGHREVAMAFLEPGVVALGSTASVRRAIDTPDVGDVTSNERLMGLMREVQSGSNAWLIARMDDPVSLAWLPEAFRSQVPSMEVFALDGRVTDSGGVSGQITAEARDEQAGQDLGDVVQGFLALVRMQGDLQPGFAGMLDGLQLTRVGRRVTLRFDLSPDTLGVAMPQR